VQIAGLQKEKAKKNLTKITSKINRRSDLDDANDTIFTFSGTVKTGK
jgi:hypothetical protein